MSNSFICNQCGERMVSIDATREHGMVCPKCGWSVATTYLDPIHEDINEYKVFLTGNSQQLNEKLVLISCSTKKTLLEVKRILNKGNEEIYRGTAIEVQTVLRSLIEAGIQVTVEPKFPYQVFEHNSEYESNHE